MSSQLNKLIENICGKEEIALETFSEGYVLLLQKNGRKMYVYGNKFANNNAASGLVCDDKAALSQILKAKGIPCVEHSFFASPRADWYGSDEREDTQRLVSMLNRAPFGLVIKENKGSGGKNVYRVTNEAQLFDAVKKVFSVSDSLAAADYIEIAHEYRVLMLDDEYVYAFEKKRRRVTGNGVDAADELIRRRYGEKYVSGGETGAYIPAAGEEYMPEWRHNLGQGALPELVTDPALIKKLAAMAKSCTEALALSFASVDIIDDGGTLRVLEINSGVMTDNFSAFSEEYRLLAENGIRAAVKSYFDR